MGDGWRNTRVIDRSPSHPASGATATSADPPTPPDTWLDRVGNVARRAAPLRWFALAAGAACGALFAGSALELPYLPAHAFIPALIGGIWSLLALTFLAAFRHVPPPVPAAARGLTRGRAKLHRGVYGALAVALGLLAVMAAYVSFSLLRLWLAEGS
jgi:hypothetical protein